MSQAPIELAVLNAACANESRLVLLLDGTIIDDLSAQVRHLDCFAPRRWLYEDTEYAQTLQQVPLLVECSHDSPLLVHFMQEWTPLHAGVLMAGARLEDLADHWRPLRHALLPDGRLCLLRAYEPQQLDSWLSAMSAVERDQLLGPAAWMAWRECQPGHDRWQRLPRSGPSPTPRPARPWSVTEAQVAAMDAHVYDKYLQALTQTLCAQLPVLAALPPSGALREVRAMAQAGRDLGYQQAEDLAGFIGLLFRHNRQCVAPGALQRLITDTHLPAWQRLERAALLIEQDVAK